MALTDPKTPEGMALQGDLLRPLEGNEMQPVQTAGLFDALGKAVGGPVLNRAQQRLRELQTQPQPAAPEIATDAVSVDPVYEAQLKAMTAPYQGDGVNIKPTEAEAAAVAKAMNRPSQVSDEGLLSDFRAVGARGDEKIPDEGRVLASIEAISQTYRADISGAARDEMKDKAVRDLANLLGTTQKKVLQTKILGRERGETFNAETMLAARDLLVSEMNTLDRLAAIAETGSDSDALKFRTQLELVSQLQAQVKGAQTEIARALSSFRIPARNYSGDQDPIMKAAATTTILDDFGGAGTVRDMAKAYRQSGSQHARAAFARSVTKLKVRESLDAFYEMWINGLLSNPVTHIKNVTGAFLTTGAHVPEMYGAAMVGGMRRALGGRGGVTAADAHASVFGAIMGLRDAYGAAARGFATGEKPLPGTKIDFQPSNMIGNKNKRVEHAFSAEAFGAQGPMGTSIDALGRLLTINRIPTRALEFEDTYFKVVAHRMSLYESAMRSGRQKGFKGDDLAEHVANYLYDPPAIAIKHADAHAKYVTLQTDLDEVGRNIGGLRKIPGMRYFLPFFKTPYNAFKYAMLDRSFVGAIYGESARAIKRANAPGASMADKAAGDLAIARLSLGTMTAALIFHFSQTGEVTGRGPTDRGLRASMMRSGWRPYSVKIGDEYFSYQTAEPFSSILGMAADAGEAMQYGGMDADKSEDIYAAVAAVVGNQLTNKTFMQGFSNLVKTLNDPVRYGKSTADSFIRSLTPRGVAAVERMMDPEVRAAVDAVDSFRSQIPGLSSSLPARRNFWGQTIYTSEAAGPDIISPIYKGQFGPNQLDPDPARAKQAFELDQEFKAIKWGPTDHPSNFDDMIEFGPMMKARFHDYAGMRALQTITQTVGMPEYQKFRNAFVNNGDKLARDQAILMLRSATLSARQMAKGDLMSDKEFGPELLELIGRANDKRSKQADNIMEVLR
jgi:hypothetical protein